MATALITRAEARAQGLKRYFTGKPCRYGHIAERQVSSLNCMECGRLKSRRDHLKRDKAKERERLRAYRAANREKINAAHRAANATPERQAYKAAWYQANRERIRAKAQAEPGKYRESNIASAAAWKVANPEKAREHSRMNRRNRRAKAKKAGGTHTAADLAEILESQGHRCAYCRADLRKTPKHVDHIVPLARGGSNGRANLQYLCQSCNQAKNWKDPVDFAQSLGLLV